MSTEEPHDTTGSEESSESFLVQWDDVNKDKISPRSLAKLRKWIIICTISHASFCVTATSSIYTASYQQMEHEFGNSRLSSLLGLSSFVLGLAFGPLCFAPLSEFYGRRPIYLVAWSMYTIWIIPQAVAQNVETIIITRFLGGFSGSTFLAVSGGTVSDLFAKEEIQLPMAIFSVSPFLGPCIGPLIGGFINYYSHWRWTYYVLIIWSSSLLMAIVILVPETLHPIILKRKASKLRKDTGEERWRAPSELEDRSIIGTVGRSLLRPIQLLVLEPMCLSMCIYSAILLGILYLFFGAFPLIFERHYGFNLWQVGLSFLGIGLGLMLGVLTDPVWPRIRSAIESNAGKEVELAIGNSEFRLLPALLGSMCAPIGLFIFAWTTYSWIHWTVPILGSCMFGFGNILIFTGIFTFLVDTYPDYAASALAANTFLRCMLAAAFPIFGDKMFRSLGFQWASSVLAFLTLVMMPLPWIFFRWGKRIRSRSHFARA